MSVDTTSTSSYTGAVAAAETVATSLAGIFDDFDWDLDSAESFQCLSEEDLKKRRSVMIEKVPCLHFLVENDLCCVI